jgi:hypothetical protein
VPPDFSRARAACEERARDVALLISARLVAGAVHAACIGIVAMTTIRAISIIVTVGLAFATTAEAQPAASAADKAAKQPEKTPAIDPNALAALDKMGAFLREQQSFTVGTNTETDYVLDDGQKVRLSSRGDLRVRRPDHLRAHVVSDRKERQFYYDGKTFTIFSPRIGHYASVPAPPTIVELADQLEARYGLMLPMVDLFRWGTDDSAVKQITQASYVGTTKLDGVVTDHWAFRQPGLDWQIWIERGDKPVPRKLVLTTTDDPARPEHAIEMTWNLGSRHEDSVFAFEPPKGAQKIALAEVTTQRAPTARRARR